VAEYGLTDHLRFDTEIIAAAFDQDEGHWRIDTASGAQHTATVLITACGQLSRPRFPDIPGLQDFTGEIFHSAAWNHDYDLAGKRVAVVGNGASAVQLIPQIAGKVRELSVFQRSAEYLIPKPDFNLEGTILERLPLVQKVARGAVWGIGEYLNPALTRDFGRFHNAYLAPFYLAMKAQLHLQIRDKELRSKLTPDYRMGCKRILLSSNYYPAIARDNVEVVTDSITGITGSGVVTADGAKREYDAIIFATGFQTNGFIAPMRITGLGDQELSNRWADAPEAYLGITVDGFPNMFLMYGPNTNFGGGSIVYILESQARYIVDAVRQLERTGATYLDVKKAAFDKFGAEAQGRLAHSVWVTGGCTSWYTNGKGKVTNNWPGLMIEYRRRTNKIRLSDYRVVH
jgi:cation diffusion facilitator CzcD-associated flavoprotein CzcO